MKLSFIVEILYKHLYHFYIAFIHSWMQFSCLKQEPGLHNGVISMIVLFEAAYVLYGVFRISYQNKTF